MQHLVITIAISPFVMSNLWRYWNVKLRVAVKCLGGNLQRNLLLHARCLGHPHTHGSDLTMNKQTCC